MFAAVLDIEQMAVKVVMEVIHFLEPEVKVQILEMLLLPLIWQMGMVVEVVAVRH